MLEHAVIEAATIHGQPVINFETITRWSLILTPRGVLAKTTTLSHSFASRVPTFRAPNRCAVSLIIPPQIASNRKERPALDVAEVDFLALDHEKVRVAGSVLVKP